MNAAEKTPSAEYLNVSVLPKSKREKANQNYKRTTKNERKTKTNEKSLNKFLVLEQITSSSTNQSFVRYSAFAKAFLFNFLYVFLLTVWSGIVVFQYDNYPVIARDLLAVETVSVLPVNPMEREGERREKEKTRNAVHLLSRPCALYHAGQHITVECEHVQKERKQTWNLFGPLPLTMLPWKSMPVY